MKEWMIRQMNQSVDVTYEEVDGWMAEWKDRPTDEWVDA